MISSENCLFDSANEDYKYDSDAQLGDKITELSGRVGSRSEYLELFVPTQ